MTPPKHPDEKEAHRLAIRSIALAAVPLVSAAALAVGVAIDNAGLTIVGIVGLALATLPALVALSIDLEELGNLLRRIDQRKWEEHQREQARIDRITKEMGW